MFYAPPESSRSHHPADQARPDQIWSEHRFHHFDLTRLQGWRSKKAEADLPEKGWDEEPRRALRMGLTGADSIKDKSIPTFRAGWVAALRRNQYLPQGALRRGCDSVGGHDATVLGIPFDGGTTDRPGIRFGPQGLPKISALHNFAMAVALREQMTLCDAGDVFTIPAKIEKSFDQISRAVSHVASSGRFPIMVGGDHSIGYPWVKGIADVTSKKIGIVHFARQADIQEKDLDEWMHTTPWFHATNMPNVPAKNLVPIGIGGWQAPREAVKVGRERETNIMTICGVARMGIDRTAEMALEMAWDGVDMVYMSFDIERIDCGLVPGTGRPGPGGFLPREALALASKVAAERLCGIELVEVSPPYDTSDITALLGTHVIVDVLGSMVAAGKHGAHRKHIDRPVTFPHGDFNGKRWSNAT